VSNTRTVLLGLVQALATVLIAGIALKMVAQIQKWESPSNGYFDDFALLLIFVTSALVSGTLVLAYPAYLLLQQRLKEGFLLLFSTIAWLILMLIGVLMAIVFFDIHTIF
jgi:hypothetical protein